MKCPHCGAWTYVLETRKYGENQTRRRYECANEHRFTTLEGIVDGRCVRVPGRTAGVVQAAPKRKKKSLPSQEVRPQHRKLGRVQEGSGKAKREGLQPDC